MLQGINKDKKARNKIMAQGEKKFCGIDKKVLYKECILPVLLTVCESRNANIIDLISTIVKQISEVEQPREQDVEMDQEQDQDNVENQRGPKQKEQNDQRMEEDLQRNEVKAV